MYGKIKRDDQQDIINQTVELPQVYTDIHSSPTIALFKHSGICTCMVAGTNLCLTSCETDTTKYTGSNKYYFKISNEH